MNIQFKNEKIFQNFCRVSIHPNLTALLFWFWRQFADVIITSAWRPNKIYGRDSGIHRTDPLRAVDIRSFIYTNPKRIVDEINRTWIYDPARPEKKCAVYHDIGRGVHIHLQVSNNTTQKE